MSTIDAIRQEWADGHRRLEAARDDPPRYRALLVQLDAYTDELRRRVGGVYTLAELAAEYARAERWSQEVFVDLPKSARLPAGIATAVDGAFHVYARGAQDYTP